MLVRLVDTATPANPPSFEEALDQLEAIVDAMESGQVPLADLLTKYEKGSQLLQLCEARLKDAELRVELLKKQGNQASLAKFDPEADKG